MDEQKASTSSTDVELDAAALENLIASIAADHGAVDVQRLLS